MSVSLILSWVLIDDYTFLVYVDNSTLMTFELLGDTVWKSEHTILFVKVS